MGNIHYYVSYSLPRIPLNNPYKTPLYNPLYNVLEGVKTKAHVGGCQNYGLFLGTLNISCLTIMGTQKGTIILTTTHVGVSRVLGVGPGRIPRNLQLKCAIFWGGKPRSRTPPRMRRNGGELGAYCGNLSALNHPAS